MNFKKTNTPKPLAILKVDPPKKEVDFIEPHEVEGEMSPEQPVDLPLETPEEKVEPPKLDIPNYDELERKWNFKKYDELIQNIPDRSSTVASLLSACVRQVCEDLRGNKSQESTIDDELESIFSDGFSQIATNLSNQSNK